MRNYLADYQVVNCASLPEALALLAQSPAPIPIAGGTDLMVYLNYHQLPAGTYLNLHAIPELRSRISVDAQQVTLSALTTYMDVRRHSFFRENMTMLAEAAAVVGAPGIQSTGTWAGNIVNASPAADGVPALMVYDAEVILTSSQGERRVLLANFYRDYKQMDRRADELLTAIVMPRINNSKQYYRKVGERKSQAISKVLLAARLEQDAATAAITDARIVYASMMPYCYRCRTIETMLTGQRLSPQLISAAVQQLDQELRPIDDIRSTARYRLKVAGNLLEEFLSQALAK